MLCCWRQFSLALLSVRLSAEDEKKLEQILAVTQGDRSELVRKLITDQWLALRAGQTFVERRGGHPSNLLHGTGGNSSRERRKAKMAMEFESRAKRRKKTSD
jgi:hypothetical protein